ncbi:hypothetical protein BJ741DRAFT_621108, partial [Chytriomyces cf. hyalinus JEL632]
TKTESCLPTYLDGGETLVTPPTVENVDNTTAHIGFLSDSNKDVRNGDVVGREPLPPQRNRSNSPTNPDLQQYQSYPCLVPGCNNVFARAYNLKSHSYCHSGKRPHKRHSCTAPFSRKNDSQRHVRTLHTRDRPHVYSQCDQAFLTLDQLRRHIVTHTIREESRAHRRSGISRAVSNSGSLDPHAKQLFPRHQLLEETMPTQSLGSTARTDTYGMAAAAADWIQYLSSTTRLQDLPSAQPSILNASFDASRESDNRAQTPLPIFY